MTAPSSPGSYTIVMQMNNSAGAFFGQQVSLNINVVNPVPTITSQPSNQTKNPGETATFTVGASGATIASTGVPASGDALTLSGGLVITGGVTATFSGAGSTTVGPISDGGARFLSRGRSRSRSSCPSGP